jgi:hypothetical protein
MTSSIESRINSFETWIRSFTAEAEADVAKVALLIKQGVIVAAADLEKFETWLSSNLPQIVSFLLSIESMLATLTGFGVVIPPVAAAAVQEALQLGQLTGQALATYNADIAAGKSQTTALVDAYSAYLTAKAAAANATQALLSVPPKKAT